MKIEVQNKKGLTTKLSIIIDKKIIQEKLNKRLLELQSEVNLKGFRPGKVPPNVIKSQFGKAIYGEVIDQILKESSNEALKEKKIKPVGQPKIDLKVFGEGKDLNYDLEVSSLPNIKLKNFESFKATEYKVEIEKKIIEEKLNQLAKEHKHFSDKKISEKAELGDQVVFDYSATVDNAKFEGSEGKGVQLELGKDLFLKGFDNQLVGVKKNEKKIIDATLPANHPKKELANKKTKFECTILNVKAPEKTKIDDSFAKHMGAKDLIDLKKLMESQILSQFNQALNSITKKEIFDQIDQMHDIEIPENLVNQELQAITENLKKEEADKHKKENEKLAKSRIKLGLILNEYGEKNNLKVSDEEVNSEIQKQIKGMPGQEKMVLDYYQKNPSASQSIKGALYEEKIISLFKSKIKLFPKKITSKEAEKIITEFNKPKVNNYPDRDDKKTDVKAKDSSKKIDKKRKKISKK
tara:strand:+ start:521 stop:1918 length:1398 start_codon:yes stop_codon:yes gene_type:complete